MPVPIGSGDYMDLLDKERKRRLGEQNQASPDYGGDLNQQYDSYTALQSQPTEPRTTTGGAAEPAPQPTTTTYAGTNVPPPPPPPPPPPAPPPETQPTTTPGFDSLVSQYNDYQALTQPQTVTSAAPAPTAQETQTTAAPAPALPTISGYSYSGDQYNQALQYFVDRVKTQYGGVMTPDLYKQAQQQANDWINGQLRASTDAWNEATGGSSVAAGSIKAILDGTASPAVAQRYVDKGIVVANPDGSYSLNPQYTAPTAEPGPIGENPLAPKVTYSLPEIPATDQGGGQITDQPVIGDPPDVPATDHGGGQQPDFGLDGSGGTGGGTGTDGTGATGAGAVTIDPNGSVNIDRYNADMAQTIQDLLNSPSRYDSTLLKEGADIIARAQEKARQEGMRNLREYFAEHGTNDSSLEAEQVRKLETDLADQAAQQLFQLQKDQAQTWAQDMGMAASLGLDFGQQLTDRQAILLMDQRDRISLELQKQGMDQEAADREADRQLQRDLEQERIDWERERWREQLQAEYGGTDTTGDGTTDGTNDSGSGPATDQVDRFVQAAQAHPEIYNPLLNLLRTQAMHGGAKELGEWQNMTGNEINWDDPSTVLSFAMYVASGGQDGLLSDQDRSISQYLVQLLSGYGGGQ